MVLINHDIQRSISAYAVTPLTAEISRTVHRGFYDGTYACYGDPMVNLTIYDRPEFHGMSHYDMRIALNKEGQEDLFLVIDEKTADMDAVWVVETTEMDEFFKNFEDPRRTIYHPDEKFTLWQAHMRVPDVPNYLVNLYFGCADLMEDVLEFYDRYDPHDPQNKLITWGDNWTDPEIKASKWGPAYVKANLSELEWGEDPQHYDPEQFPVVARLNAAAARESGLLQSWSWQSRLAPAGSEVRLFAYYDPKSPLWPIPYHDDSTLMFGRGGTSDHNSILRPSNRIGRLGALGGQKVRAKSCARFRSRDFSTKAQPIELAAHAYLDNNAWTPEAFLVVTS
ncbi:MAG: hypothetical protein Q9223_001698 [Gallowayella weberi]